MSELGETLEAGADLPYVQSGMMLRHRDGGPVMRVRSIQGFRAPMAACRVDVGRTVYMPCEMLRKDYVLAEEFDAG